MLCAADSIVLLFIIWIFESLSAATPVASSGRQKNGELDYEEESQADIDCCCSRRYGRKLHGTGVKRSVVVNGVPFSMTLPKQEYRADRAIRAIQSLSEAAQQNGTADMSLDEINAEIAASRADRASRNARNGA